MSETNFSVRSNPADKNCILRFVLSFIHLFSLNGHLSYAFIYGSWEIIRARKVGTTHTKVDYVVYRLFYPVILIGACLFAVVAESDLLKFFALFEIWSMILHIMYAFVFLQNVLSNNLHRENVKHRQKIPERLVVTDEIEKGGHKFYICKRYSILPTEKLYYTERFIWLAFNILASTNVTIMLGHITGQIRINYKHQDDVEYLRSFTMTVLILADVIFTPIPMRLVHVVFPLAFFTIYHVFLISVFHHQELVLYKSFDIGNSQENDLVKRVFAKAFVLTIVHFCLTGIAALRDYIISLLDDSRTPKQQQSLRSQKRLARRKLMNYIEGPDGRIVGISLEKHTYVPGMDEFIKKEVHAHHHKKKVDDSGGEIGYEDDSDSEDDEEEVVKIIRKDRGGGDRIPTMSEGPRMTGVSTNQVFDSVPIPLTTKVKPPPMPRYQVTPVKDETQFSSSSSSSEGEAITKSIKRLPSPPKDPSDHYHHYHEDEHQISRIPVPIHKFGAFVKPRDSKENIHEKLDNHLDSPPTPPFVKLVQTLIKIKKEAKGEVEEQLKMRERYQQQEGDGTAVQSTTGTALVKVIRIAKPDDDKDDFMQKSQPEEIAPPIKQRRRKRRSADSKRKPKGSGKGAGQKRDDVIDKLITDATKPSKYILEKQRMEESEVAPTRQGQQAGFERGGKAVASKVIHLKNREIYDGTKPVGMSHFHRELTSKLEKERDEKLGVGEKQQRQLQLQQKDKVEAGGKKKPALKKVHKIKGILKHRELGDDERERLPADKRKRRVKRLLKRREERNVQGKHGLPVYDPLSIPENVGVEGTATTTTFHYLGTKLKGEKVEKLTVPAEDVPLYRTHPGIGTKDDGQGEDGKGKTGVTPAKSFVAFHPIVRYFDVDEVEKDDKGRKPSSKWAK